MTNRACLLALAMFCLCPLLSSAQGLDSSKDNKKKPVSSFFRIKLDALIKQKPLLARGGESGGGGEWLESKLAETAYDILVKLKENNPHKLDFNEFKDLIENTEIELSDNPNEFFLNKKKQRRDAINYFPQKLLIKFLRPKWTEYFQKNLDVRNLLYHEYLPFFFGNDADYVRSREVDFKQAETATFLNVKNGDFHSEYSEHEDNCMAKIQINSIQKTVSLYWNDNSLTGKKCSSGEGPLVFQCNTNLVNACIFQTPNVILNLSMMDPDRFTLGGGLINSEERGQIDVFVRVRSDAARKPTTLFSALQSVSNPNLNYQQNCQSAFESAEKAAHRICQTAISSTTQTCTTIDSEIVQMALPRRFDECAARVHVKLSTLQDLK